MPTRDPQLCILRQAKLAKEVFAFPDGVRFASILTLAAGSGQCSIGSLFKSRCLEML